ncbi:MAG: type IX secretion system membrane protein PorP/SprF [Bacteroidetes bacterium]|nr:MAG: type IX secretion system membrane protein PorP/SprF [Bacteroidota bacterium]
MKTLYYKLTIALVMVASIPLTSKAQDRSHFYTNLLNPLLVNPAMTGSADHLQAIFNAKTLIGGIESSPRTLNFGIHTPFANNTGVGTKIISHWVGAFQTINVEGSYSKMIRLTNDQNLTFGLSLGIVQTNLRTELLNNTVNLSDPTLISNDLNKIRIASGAGVRYQYKKSLELYASSPMMVTGDESLNGFFIAGANYTFTAGTNGDYSIKPIVNYYNMIYSPKMLDILVNAGWNETVFLTTGYRTNGSIVGGVGFNFKNVVIGYNYYHQTGDLSRLAQAQNEVAIAFNFKKPEARVKKKQEVVNEQIIQDQIDKVNDKINGLINIEKTNPGLVNVKNEMVKLNKELEKILTKYKIENIAQLKKIKELQTNIELLIAKYND